MISPERHCLIYPPTYVHSVVVSALRSGWENPSLSLPEEFELGDKCCCNLSNFIITQPFPEMP